MKSSSNTEDQGIAHSHKDEGVTPATEMMILGTKANGKAADIVVRRGLCQSQLI